LVNSHGSATTMKSRTGNSSRRAMSSALDTILRADDPADAVRGVRARSATVSRPAGMSREGGGSMGAFLSFPDARHLIDEAALPRPAPCEYIGKPTPGSLQEVPLRPCQPPSAG
jgi:hypothetical protein